MKTIFKYFRIWYVLTVRTSQIAFISRFGAVIFIIGKILRFLFFLLFLVLLESRTNAIAGYSIWQIIFFFATFNLIDSLPQFFLREVYRFRSYVVSGDLDYILTKPVSPLFRSLFGGSDILDLSILLASVIFIFISLQHLGSFNPINLILYVVLVFNAFIIALSFHIFVLAVGVTTTEVDNTIMLYRDLTMMGRVPVDIYLEPIRGILTFVIPIGIMMTFPAKVLMGLLSLQMVFISIVLASIFFLLSLRFWNYSLKLYSSASS